MQGTLIFPPKPYLPLRQSHPRRMPVRAAVAEVAQPSNRRSLYEVLQVKQNASQVEIKTAYRTMAKLYHPDASSRFRSSSDGRDFIEIQDAYSTLSDPNARAVYDLKLTVNSRSRCGDLVRSPGRRIDYPTRRWETDQCW